MKLTGTAIPLGALATKKSVGCGDFLDLFKFADLCKKSNLKIIQLLPVNDTGTESSPYSALSAFALHPIYINFFELPELQEDSPENKALLKQVKQLQKIYSEFTRYPYKELRKDKLELLKKIYIAKQEQILNSNETEQFFIENDWVKTYAVFMFLKSLNNEASYKQWTEYKTVNAKKIDTLWNDNKAECLFYVWVQQRLSEQFAKAAEYARSLGIMIKGDIPIMMNEDSADAWGNPAFFNDSLRAGSPVDGENPRGQNWGFPTYNWKNLKKDKYSWWKNRLICASKYYDMYRIDHILGFFRIWAIPYGECSAILGHTDPFEPITIQELKELGFDESRIRWLSKPHVETRIIQDVHNGDYLGTHGNLHKIMDRIGDEELWLFKDSIKTDQDIWDKEEIPFPIRERLTQKWVDRMLVEVEGGYFPIWTYTNSTAWQSLSETEKHSFAQLLNKKNVANEKLWEKQARTLLKELTECTKMIPCAEDLGANIECLPSVLDDLNIQRLCVVRWKREWAKPGQPFIAFEEYPQKSVTTTSVHDSSTLRLWWTAEHDANDFKQTFFKDDSSMQVGKYNSKTAKNVLQKVATSNSMYVINPFQDFLSLSEKYYAENLEDERINVPGSVNTFNWTYKLPETIEDLLKDKELIDSIKAVAKR